MQLPIAMLLVSLLSTLKASEYALIGVLKVQNQ